MGAREVGVRGHDADTADRDTGVDLRNEAVADKLHGEAVGNGICYDVLDVIPELAITKEHRLSRGARPDRRRIPTPTHR